ncbi:MAG: hypothetical protein ACKV22_35565 [Bryobacteraceae bacterium]
MKKAAWAAVLLGVSATAQEVPVILQVDTENSVVYGNEYIHPSQLAQVPDIPNVAGRFPVNFGISVGIADVTAVNGSPARGVLITEAQQLRLSPTASPGMAISDVTRNGSVRLSLELLHPDGRSVGSIFAAGLAAGGSPLPGGGVFAITGGLGAFQGVTGIIRAAEVQMFPRNTSQVEDPSRRRINGGGRLRYPLQITSRFQPEVLTGANGPAVFHGDFNPVTAASPARAGETLIVYAKGLGPTTASLNPGDPFPSEPLAIATSPVEVLVNGKASAAINQVGVPGTTDTYRVDFRVPDDTPGGTASVQLRAAWVPGSAVSMPVR